MSPEGIGYRMRHRVEAWAASWKETLTRGLDWYNVASENGK